jgi:hypothetical protein
MNQPLFWLFLSVSPQRHYAWFATAHSFETSQAPNLSRAISICVRSGLDYDAVNNWDHFPVHLFCPLPPTTLELTQRLARIGRSARKVGWGWLGRLAKVGYLTTLELTQRLARIHQVLCVLCSSPCVPQHCQASKGQQTVSIHRANSTWTTRKLLKALPVWLTLC